MAAPRKVFRIEEMAVTRLPEREAPRSDAELLREIGALREMLAAADRWQSGSGPMGEAETERLASQLSRIVGAIGGGMAAPAGDTAVEPPSSMTRIAHELEAVVAGTEQATQKILAAAEEIDQLANNLSAALYGRVEQGLAQDIRDLVIRIFEACNFQDLAGQRVAKVMTTLHAIELHIEGLLDEIRNMPKAKRSDGTQFLHGPRLDNEAGHATQAEIDALFAS